MIIGAHVIHYSANADADRAFLRDVLKFPSVDAGRGWLIFALPPSELAAHPGENGDGQELYLMTDNLDETMAELRTHHVPMGAPVDAPWGRLVQITLPSGSELGLYQPFHPLAINATKKEA